MGKMTFSPLNKNKLALVHSSIHYAFCRPISVHILGPVKDLLQGSFVFSTIKKFIYWFQVVHLFEIWVNLN